MRILRLSPRGKGASLLGPLESQLMEIVWDSTGPVSVRDVHTALARRKRELAYSTVKAVLTNLASKGYLLRIGKRKANYFSASESREKFKEKTVTAVIDSLLKDHREALIANLVDRVVEDEKTLHELEKLIERKRAELHKA